jgi:hypothetical protein
MARPGDAVLSPQLMPPLVRHRHQPVRVDWSMPLADRDQAEGHLVQARGERPCHAIPARHSVGFCIRYTCLGPSSSSHDTG